VSVGMQLRARGGYSHASGTGGGAAGGTAESGANLRRPFESLLVEVVPLPLSILL